MCEGHFQRGCRAAAHSRRQIDSTDSYLPPSAREDDAVGLVCLRAGLMKSVHLTQYGPRLFLISPRQQLCMVSTATRYAISYSYTTIPLQRDCLLTQLLLEFRNISSPHTRPRLSRLVLTLEIILRAQPASWTFSITSNLPLSTNQTPNTQCISIITYSNP